MINNKKTFIFPLSEIQVAIEADSFKEAQEEYEKIRRENSEIKIQIEKSPPKKPIKKGFYDHIISLKENGFFAEGRTIGDVKNKLAELAINCKTTTLQPYLARLIKESILIRKREERDDKEA